MDLHTLELFTMIVGTGSFSKAADAARLTQPTVSGHIKKLEDEVGVRLLDRLGHRATPTKAGDLLYHYATRILMLRQEAHQALNELRGGLKGELILGASSIPGGYLLPPLIGQFRARFQDITVVLKVSDSKEIIEAVINGAYEIGVVGARFDDSRIEYRRFAEDEIVLVVPPTHPWAPRKRIKASELLEQPFLVRERGSGTRKIMEQALGQHHLSIDAFKVVAEMGSNEAIRQAVKAGSGIAIISRLAVASDLKCGELTAIPVSGLKLIRPFYLITHRHRSRSPICNAFLTFLSASTRSDHSRHS